MMYVTTKIHDLKTGKRGLIVPGVCLKNALE